MEGDLAAAAVPAPAGANDAANAEAGGAGALADPAEAGGPGGGNNGEHRGRSRSRSQRGGDLRGVAAPPNRVGQADVGRPGRRDVNLNVFYLQIEVMPNTRAMIVSTNASGLIFSVESGGLGRHDQAGPPGGGNNRAA